MILAQPRYFVDIDFINQSNLKPKSKKYPESLKLVDGRESSGGSITHEIELSIQIDNHSERTLFQVTKLSDYPLILGKAWLDQHNPSINWPYNLISFPSQFCSTNCLLESKSLFVPQSEPKVSDHSILFPALVKLAKHEKLQIFAVSAEDVKEHLNKAEKSEIEEREELLNKIPPEFHDLLPLFTKKEADKLPPHRYIDHTIEIQDNKKPPFSPMYNMSNPELQAY